VASRVVALHLDPPRVATGRASLAFGLHPLQALLVAALLVAALLVALCQLHLLPPRRVVALAGDLALAFLRLGARARLLLSLLFATLRDVGARTIGLLAHPRLRPCGQPALRLRSVFAIRDRRTLALRLWALPTGPVGSVASR